MRIAHGLLAVCLLLLALPAQAQSAGDVAFSSYASDAPDRFSFVALADLPMGTAISFTDNGWLAAGGFRMGEGEIEWTTTTLVTAGTEIAIDVTSLTASTGAVASISGSVALSASGDQLIAFTGAFASPTPIAALQMNGAWDADATSSNTSALPTGLVDGDTAMAIDPEVDNGVYDCTSGSAGTAANLRALLHDPTLWNVDDDDTLLTLPAGCGFSITTGPVCGDNVCDAGETINNCAGDCGIVDPFQSGTTLGWGVGGSGTPPGVIASGGPTGTGDGFLEVVSDGSGANGKIVIVNGAQWSGDYAAREQDTLYLHASTPGPNPIVLRAVVQDGTGQATPNRAISAGVTIPGDGTWHLVELDLSAGSMIALAGSASAALANVVQLRIIDNVNPTYPPPSSTKTLQLDNISNLPLAALCGDNVVNGTDTCDGVDLGGADCTGLGYSNPAGLTCSASCDMLVSTGCTSTCGDGATEPGEACDTMGQSATCDSDCTAPSCGDGECNPAAGETFANCADCQGTCGDGAINAPTEVCDGADVGTETCETQGFDAGTLACLGTCAGLDTSGCTFTCGNDEVGGTETCDGTDLDGTDCTMFGFSNGAGLACNATCDGFDQSACQTTCGDGTMEPGEGCDDGNVMDGDGCSATCEVETGVCGDGTLEGSEACDDGNATDGDGCSATCTVEAGFTCDTTVEPSACIPDESGGECGDGMVDAGEECDDGNLSTLDGCSETCTIETAPIDPGVTQQPIDPDDGGCGCRTAGAPSRHGAAWWLLGLAGIAIHRRRRARAGS